MSGTLIIVLATIALLFLLFLLVYIFRERAEIIPEEDRMILKKPFKEREYKFEQDLKSWKLQQAYYLRWGRVYSVNMLFKNGKRVGVGSRFNQSNFEQLYEHLNSRYKKREEPGD